MTAMVKARSSDKAMTYTEWNTEYRGRQVRGVSVQFCDCHSSLYTRPTVAVATACLVSLLINTLAQCFGLEVAARRRLQQNDRRTEIYSCAAARWRRGTVQCGRNELSSRASGTTDVSRTLIRCWWAFDLWFCERVGRRAISRLSGFRAARVANYRQR